MLKHFLISMRKKALINKCDKLFSIYIRKKFKKCEICSNPETLQPSHCYSRMNMSVRWNEMNVLCLCDKHHREWEVMSQKEREHFLIGFLGELEFKYLLKEKNTIKQWTLSELQSLSEFIKERINNL
jgi:hypothetical protein